MCLRKNNRLTPLVLVLAPAALLCSCGKSPQPIVVGSQNSTGQSLVAEIVAQHLERRLGQKIERRLAIGPEPVLYQELLTRQISLYPALTGAIETEILKETPSSDPSVVWERTRGEMSRLSKLELFDPRGYDNPPVMVIRTVDASGSPVAKLSEVATLSDAASASAKWKVGMSYEFQQRIDGIPLPSAAIAFPWERPCAAWRPPRLFPALYSAETLR